MGCRPLYLNHYYYYYFCYHDYYCYQYYHYFYFNYYYCYYYLPLTQLIHQLPVPPLMGYAGLTSQNYILSSINHHLCY